MTLKTFAKNYIKGTFNVIAYENESSNRHVDFWWCTKEMLVDTISKTKPDAEGFLEIEVWTDFYKYSIKCAECTVKKIEFEEDEIIVHVY